LTAEYFGKLWEGMRDPKTLGRAAGVALVAGAIGSYPWSEWALGESKEIMGGTAFNVNQLGDPEIMREYAELNTAIADLTLWENIQRLIPGANIAFSFGEKAKATVFEAKVNTRFFQDQAWKIENNATEYDMWVKIRADQLADENAAVDYYNTARKAQVTWENEQEKELALFKQDVEMENIDYFNERRKETELWLKELKKSYSESYFEERKAESVAAIKKFYIRYRGTRQRLLQRSYLSASSSL
jgi:hypothetical protein